MVPNQTDRVWLLPQKFWSATKEMPPEEVEALMERLMIFSAARDFESLQKFDFVVVGKPHINNAA